MYIRKRKPTLFPSSAIFRDIHDLVLEDEEIGGALAGEPHHVLVVILDPSVDGLAVQELNGDRLLLLPQRLEERSFLESILRRRRPTVLDGLGIPLGSAERHAGIVHKAWVTKHEG